MNKLYSYELKERKQNLFTPQILVKTKNNFQLNWSKKDYKINNNKKENNKLINAKNQIDKYYNKREWDRVKKLTNPFEMVHITNKYNKRNSISYYNPLSRSYFKMVEMIHEFLEEYIHQDLLLNKLRSVTQLKVKGINTLHLAEGPGGFMEAFLNYRKNKNDNYYGMTLTSTNKNIPGWYKSNIFINKHTNINIITGVDGTGNLYTVNNHYYLINRFGKNSMDIITGDGGFDFSVDFNMQEELAQKLIYSQIIIGFAMLKKGGTFICKFFDTFTNLTKEFIFLLNIFYEKVTIYKPYTSRLANSERYIVCQNYKGIDTLYLNELIQVLDIWNSIDNMNEMSKKKEIVNKKNFNRNSNPNYITSISSIINIFNHTYNHTSSNEYLNKLYNEYILDINAIINEFQDIQIENINETIDIIKYNQSDKWFGYNCKNQIKIAIQWCKKYNVPHKTYLYNINYKSIY